jgi:CyaY protein
VGGGFFRGELDAGLDHAETGLVVFFGQIKVALIAAGAQKQSGGEPKYGGFHADSFFGRGNVARFGILNKNARIHKAMMTESGFLQHTDALFAHIEDQIDEGGWDFDCRFAGNVLTIEADNGTQIIVNRHTPNQELWIAAKSGGYHFSEQNGRWLATRDGSEFFAVLNEALSAACGEAVQIDAFA